MLPIGFRIQEIYRDRDVTLKHACVESGVSYGTLHQQIAKDREIPFSTIDQLARYFELPLEYFSARRAAILVEPNGLHSPRKAAEAARTALHSNEIVAIEDGLQITTDMVLDWLDRENGVLRNFEHIREKVDLFYPATQSDRIIRAARLGKESLATIFLI